MSLLRLRRQAVTKSRVLVVAIVCGLILTWWFLRRERGSPGDQTLAVGIDDDTFGAAEDSQSAFKPLTGPVGYKIDDSRWRSISHELVSKPPPWTPLDTGALDRNFKALTRVAQRLTRRRGGMTHSLPVISTAHWRLHSPSGRQLSIESVQRSLLLGSQGYPVPNAAHFILPYRDPSLQFHHMVSILSCLHVMRPQLLILWYAPGRMTRGKWWTQLRGNLSMTEWENRVVMATRPLPEFIYSNPITGVEHQSDIVRMEALLMFGGVYLDIDVIVLKPLEPLRRYPFVIGRERDYGLCNGAFLSAPNSTFLAMWHTAYQVFNGSVWAQHSVLLPHRLHRQFPELCHVEDESMDRPNWKSQEISLIYGIGRQKGWNWRAKNYMLHLWFRWYHTYYDTQTIRRLNSMYGEICRFVLYGTTNLM